MGKRVKKKNILKLYLQCMLYIVIEFVQIYDYFSIPFEFSLFFRFVDIASCSQAYNVIF